MCVSVSWKEKQIQSETCAGMFENFQIKIFTFNTMQKDINHFFLISIFGRKKFRLCAGAVLKHMPNHIDYTLQADKGRKSKVRVQGH